MVADEVDLLAVTDDLVSVFFVDESEMEELVVKDEESEVELFAVTDADVSVMFGMVEEFEILVVIVIVVAVVSVMLFDE